MEYDGSHKYEIVFVDEYNNWWHCGFYDDLNDALPQVNDFLGQYQLDEGEECPCPEFPILENRKIWLGEGSPFGTLTEDPNTYGPTICKSFATPEGSIQVRGFVWA